MLRMPLKLKWGKKYGRYDLSQDVYVLIVYVGPNPCYQCTLTTDSTARQCMEYLSQKFGLNQVDMFGFRYQMKTNDPDNRLMRWVEPDKPLRKQLEKWACKPRQVQLAVLYHTPNAFSITDPTARSIYFALMKHEVVEGRLTVELEKYIGLAAHSLQVEYGDYDPTVCTIEFLQSIPLLPKHICRSAQILEDLLKRVSANYEKLRGLSGGKAALLYIVDALQCEGYGEEYFSCKDEDSTEVKIGYSQEGIVIKGSYSAPLKHKWQDVKEIQASKRHLNLKCVDGSFFQFTMSDAETARYVAMVLNWQYQYAMNGAVAEKNCPMEINNGEYASSVATADSAYSSSSQQLSLTKPTLTNNNISPPAVMAASMFNLPTTASNNLEEAQQQKQFSSAPFCKPVSVKLESENQKPNVFGMQQKYGYGSSSASWSQLSGLEIKAPVSSSNSNTASPICKPPPYYTGLTNSGNVIPHKHFDEKQLRMQQYAKQLQVEEYRNLYAEKKKYLSSAKTAGSSPEIHMIGVGKNRDCNTSLMHKQSLVSPADLRTTRCQKRPPTHALSSPDLLTKCQSTPDLVSSNINRYKMAVAKRDLQNKECSCITNEHRVNEYPNPAVSQPSNGYDLAFVSTSMATTNCSYSPSTSIGYSACCNVPMQSSATNDGQFSAVKRHSVPQNSNESCLMNKHSDRCRRMVHNMHYHRAPAPATSYYAQAGQIYYPQSSPLTQAMHNAAGKNRDNNTQQRNIYFRTPVLHYSTPNMALSVPHYQSNSKFGSTDASSSTSVAANSIACNDLQSPPMIQRNCSLHPEMQISNDNLIEAKNSISMQDNFESVTTNSKHFNDPLCFGENHLPLLHKDAKHSAIAKRISDASGQSVDSARSSSTCTSPSTNEASVPSPFEVNGGKVMNNTHLWNISTPLRNPNEANSENAH
uniref:protein-tyrosine-phosphatase n=1 Tax=Syphacia muris TaxID=451379 RepID=A0A0N5AJX0_9BILA